MKSQPSEKEQFQRKIGNTSDTDKALTPKPGELYPLDKAKGTAGKNDKSPASKWDAWFDDCNVSEAYMATRDQPDPRG